uniref:BHLH domain-containing protein n=1 Tax=Trichobilharzia regenti TaxID=157069 RepID=A0AA85IJJ2_TRIRE|nr:unnamed protein product [Trichobilharzia regenti]
MDIEDNPYHQRKSMNQSFLESIIEKHFYSSNYNRSDSQEIDILLESPSSSSQFSTVQQRQQHSTPLTLSEHQNSYETIESLTQLNDYSLVNQLNPSVCYQSNNLSGYIHISNDNNCNHLTYMSTPYAKREFVNQQRNDEDFFDYSSFDAGKTTVTIPTSIINRIENRQSENFQSQFQNSEPLVNQLIVTSPDQISPFIQEVRTEENLSIKYPRNSPVVQNDQKNSKIRYNSTRILSTIRRQHQREQDKNRTRTLNAAFCNLRSCLPEIPKDTKLTKIRTLRYAITYIRQLMDLLQETDPVFNASSLMFNGTVNSLKMEPDYDQLSMKDSGYLSFMDR